MYYPIMYGDSGDSALAGLGDHVSGHGTSNADGQRLSDDPQNSAAEEAQVVAVNEAVTGEHFLHTALDKL